MKETIATDVLICGAGAAGLTLAIELARRGVAFRLIEKAPLPFHGSRGKGIQPRTLEIFEDMGCLNHIAARGGPYPVERKYQKEGSFTDTAASSPHNVSPAEPYQYPLMVAQFHTEQVLRERLLELGVRVEFGCELLGVEQDEKGVTAHLAGPSGEETLRVRYLIGADGGRSFVRHALGIDFPGKTLGIRALVADVKLSGLSRDVWHKYVEDPAAMIMICPLAGTDMFQLQGPVPFEGECDLSAEALGALVAERTGRNDIHIESVSWASTYTMNARLADRYRADSIFLVGDAAHIHPPTGGQGLNTSVQDAYNLGWKLAAVIQGAPDVLLDSYESERRPVAAAMLGLSTKLLKAAGQGEFRRGREEQQLDIGYPDSPLTLQADSPVDGLNAGDRAPDALLSGAGNQDLRLFSLLQGTHWTLIGYEVEKNPTLLRPNLHIHIIGQHGDVIDRHNHFKDAYMTHPGDWLLIRPDGYISAIIRDGGIALLEGCLAQAGLMPVKI